MLRLTLVALLLAPLTACTDTGTFTDGGPDTGQLDTGPIDLGPPADAYVNPCGSGAAPVITGTVYAPNGTDPVAGATVGVAISLPALPASVQCERCTASGRFATQTFTDADGTFRLERIPGGDISLVLQKGYFRRVLDLKVDCAAPNIAIDKAQGTLPGKSAQYGPRDIVPRIAVVTGVWDNLEKVLDKLGVADKTVFNGKDLGTGPGSLQALLQNAALLRTYHLVFINCGTQFENLVTSDSPARNAIREYVRQGGRLFVTDLSYDFIEQVFPEYIDFEGSDGTGATIPEDHNAAEVGTKDLTINAEVTDTQLRDWLALPEINALGADKHVELVGFKTGWTVAKKGDDTLGVKVWVQGPARWIGGSGTRPLTMSYDFLDKDRQGCGRVLFSSYHAFGNAPVLLAQERILEYLMLEMGNCISIK
ncbi:MAG: carboxypeptidase regulatory-like domain-containing protein [Myxococcales bacterium]|nr:carboxypeptidase regulatory-like domain-containing protein [Myxococcales bacterium]